MTLHQAGQYDVTEVTGGFRAVELTGRGRDINAPSPTKRDQMALTGDNDAFTVTYDSGAEHYLVEVHGSDDDFCAVKDAVYGLHHCGELDIVFLDYDEGQLAVSPNLEAPAEQDAEEPGHVNPMCATIAQLINAELSSLVGSNR